MHTHRVENWEHNHIFNLEKKGNETRTRIVVIITLLAMFGEIVVGWLTNSMALLADGWHMGTHAFALGITVFAYVLARKFARDDRYAFGTWKIEILGAFSSAIVLGMAGVLMVFSSIERMINPLTIALDQAIIATIIGLSVNVVCALILSAGGGHSHAHYGEDSHSHDHDHAHADDHEHDHDHGHEHADKEIHDHGSVHVDHKKEKHEDLNFKSAYIHVVTDAITSVLAIVALLSAKYFGLTFLDPFMGIVGAVLILRWSYLLLRDTSSILLDRHENNPLKKKIITRIESDGDSRVCDLHLWKVEQNSYSCIISLIVGNGTSADEYKNRLNDLRELIHVTIETNPCEESCLEPA